MFSPALSHRRNLQGLFAALFFSNKLRRGTSRPLLTGRNASQEYLEWSSTILNQYRLLRRDVGNGPEMSRKSRSPGCLALVIVDLGTAFARAFARAQDPHGRRVPVSVQPCSPAMTLTIRASGCPKMLWATLMSNVIVFSCVTEFTVSCVVLILDALR